MDKKIDEQMRAALYSRYTYQDNVSFPELAFNIALTIFFVCLGALILVGTVKLLVLMWG